MSAVYALGRNPCPRAVKILLKLLRSDSNAYVRKATAWSLGNYPDAPVLKPLIHSLQNDVAAVRLWASGSLAEAGSISSENAEKASIHPEVIPETGMTILTEGYALASKEAKREP